MCNKELTIIFCRSILKVRKDRDFFSSEKGSLGHFVFMSYSPSPSSSPPPETCSSSETEKTSVKLHLSLINLIEEVLKSYASNK